MHMQVCMYIYICMYMYGSIKLLLQGTGFIEPALASSVTPPSPSLSRLDLAAGPKRSIDTLGTYKDADFRS